MIIIPNDTATLERKGLVQVRIDMFPENGEYGYINNSTPFHVHFMYIDPDEDNEGMMDKAEAAAESAWASWVLNQTPHPVTEHPHFPGWASGQQKTKVDDKANDIKQKKNQLKRVKDKKPKK